MKRLLFLLTLLAGLAIGMLSSTAPVTAQGPITVTSNKFTNNFRRNLLFQLEAQSSAKISQVALFVQITGLSATTRQVPDFNPDTKISATYTWNLVQNYIPPGSSGQYWWTIQDSSGNSLTTDKQAFRVDDPAYKWQKLSNDKLALYWYQGGDSFGKALFDKANQSIAFLQQDTGVTVDQQVSILIYASHDDLMQALAVGSQEWTGGQNFPDYGVVVIGVEPSNLDWGLGATTHELTHQVIHQKVRGPLGDLSLTRWMDEGLAVYYENPGKVDVQFQGPLRRAIQNDTLMPLRSLSSFPADPAAANLAYGESWSVVDFIIRRYGKEKLAALLQEFKAGGYYDDVFMNVLGVDTDGLESAWRQDIGAKPRVVPTRSNAQPTAFPTYSLSTDLGSSSSTSSGASSSASSSAASSAPTATPKPVAVNATPPPVAPGVPPGDTGKSPANPLPTLCGGIFGVVVLGLFGAWRGYKRVLGMF